MASLSLRALASFSCALALSFAPAACGGDSSSPGGGADEDEPSSSSGGSSGNDGEGPGTSSSSSGSSSGGSSGNTGESPSGELRIATLNVTAPTLTGGVPTATESAATTFIAIVTDVHGLDAIAGGQLMDDRGTVYAPFGAGANKGTYSATIDFATINSLRPMTFGANATRVFVAKFFDNVGNEATASVTVSLACRHPVAGLTGAVNGVCIDSSKDARACGPTATVCVAGQACVQGVCGPVPESTVFKGYSICLPVVSVQPGTTCTQICASQAGTSCATDKPETLGIYETSECKTAAEKGTCATPTTVSNAERWFDCDCTYPL